MCFIRTVVIIIIINASKLINIFHTYDSYNSYINVSTPSIWKGRGGGGGGGAGAHTSNHNVSKLTKI